MHQVLHLLERDNCHNLYKNTCKNACFACTNCGDGRGVKRNVMFPFFQDEATLTVKLYDVHSTSTWEKNKEIISILSDLQMYYFDFCGELIDNITFEYPRNNRAQFKSISNMA
jgi:hypothetical protein